MKILAIRGENLASLVSFEIDFERGPLADTRIVAITGPTGAGKSTLLDAMCLAIYDSAPRLGAIKEGGSGDLSSSDPRSIVRRGTGRGKAEVDFVAADGERLRATWEAWRAHDRADGRFQAQVMSLVSLDTKRDLSGAHKTETLEIIRDRIGLSFDEFRRAVLLAQGEFAAFLEAKPDTRAELLEKMTGTRIYAAVSRAAFERAREEDQALVRLERERAEIAPLDGPAREALEAEAQRLNHARQQLQSAVEALDRAVSFWVEDARLEEELLRANEALAASSRAFAELEPMRAELDRAVDAEGLRPVFEARARTRREAEALGARAAEASVARTAEFSRATAATARQAETAQALELIRARRSQLEPEVERARALDAQLDAARAAEREASQEAELRKKSEEEARRGLDGALDEWEAATRARAEVEAWLGANAGVAPVAAQWPRWSNELERAGAAVNRATELESGLAQARLRTETATRGLSVAEPALAAELARAEALDADVKKRREALEKHRTDQTASDRAVALEHLARLEATLQAAHGLVPEARRLKRSIATTEKTEAIEQESSKRASRERARLEAELLGLREQRKAAEAEVAQADFTAELAAKKNALLSPGEPCPLCGSADHPWAAREVTPIPQATAARARVETLAEQEAAKERAVASAAADAESHRAAADQLGIRRAELDQSLVDELDAWGRAREELATAWTRSAALARLGVGKLALRLPAEPTDRVAARGARDVLSGLAAAQRDLRQHGEREVERTTALEEARQAREVAEAALTEARAKESSARREAEAAQTALERIAADLGAARAAVSEARTALEPAFASWPGFGSDVERSPRRLAEQAAARVEAFEEKRSAEVAIKERSVQAKQALDLARAEHQRRQDARSEAEATRISRREALAGLSAARAQVLGGASVEVWVAEMNREEATARQALDEATAAAASAEQSAAVADAQVRTLEADLARAAAERAGAERAFLEALAGANLSSEDELAALLDRGAQWIRETRASLDAAREARTRAETTVQDRQERRERHRAAGEPELDRAAAEVKRGEARTALEATVRAQMEAGDALRRDDETRGKLAALAPRIEARRSALETAQELSAIIGSADGRKFRTVAQGLTLEILIEQANLHLEKLRPRYRLLRARDGDMELRIEDRDLGDEVRFIASLSGGEKFLVSLALALALSTISSKNVEIGSLFIDEGFGSLDRDALEVALATLDQLQAEGRTIGIVSHVQDIAERIGYQVEVRPAGPGRSEAHVHAI